jgi:hypothetical protein
MTKVMPLLAVFTLLFSFSCSEETTIDFPFLGEPVIKISQDTVQIDMSFETISLDGSISFPIPEFENSSIELYPEADSTLGTHLRITLWIGDLLNTDLQLLPPTKLPDGRNLPGVAKGFLPSVSFQVPSMGDMTFYIGKDFFGFFAPFENGQQSDTILTGRVYNNGTRLGNISLVGSEEGRYRGALVLLNTDIRIKKRLKSILESYNN